jgi:hypothetical protein
LVELPTPLKAGGQVEEWTAFLQELRQDPGLMKSKRLKTVFTAVLIEPEGAQARLSLVEWKEGRLQIMKLPVGGEERLCTALTRKSNAKLRTSSARKSVVERVRAILPLLSYYDSGEAVLAEGVAPEMASSQPESPTLYTQRAEGDFLRDRRGDQNALDGQGYGVVVKQGTWDRYRGLLEELLKHREQQAGGFMVFQVETEAVASVARAREWVRGEYLGLSEERQPAYLLILGDLDEVPLPLQQALSAEAYVGRLAFTGPDGKSDERAYEEYARKVVAWEKRPAPAQRARALFYSVDDGTAAVEAGNAALVVPGYRSFLEGHEGDDSGRFENVERLGEDSWCSGPEQLLYDPAIAEPAILMTLSHGCGSPRGGWKGDSNLPRSLQGAMSFGGGIYLTASEMRHQTFIPGGIWFFMACFSAGTPAESNYESWLQHLRTKKIEVKDVLAGLAKRPFIAALPQAVLANPAGPQAVIGHMDLAWTFGLRESTDGRALHYRHRRITDVLKILGTEPRKRSGVWGSTLGGPGRVGPAFSELARSVSRFDKELAEHRAASARAGDYAAVDGELWMGRQDLNDYVLLGDPAVHLPLKRPEPREPSVSAILGFAPNQPSESGTAVTEELEERLWVALPHIDAYRKGGLEALRHAGFDNPEAVEAEILTMVRNLGAQATLGKLDRAKAIYRQGGFAALEKD